MNTRTGKMLQSYQKVADEIVDKQIRRNKAALPRVLGCTGAVVRYWEEVGDCGWSITFMRISPTATNEINWLTDKVRQSDLPECFEVRVEW